MTDPRTAPTGRDQETREIEERETHYRPPANLPDPAPQDGYVFRWIRTDMLGDPDNRNVSMRFREGWVPCLKDEHPELMVLSDLNTQFEDNIVVGGLMLCKCSEEEMRKREEYYAGLAQRQAESVNQNYMRENDSRMPLLETERKSSTTFGVGRRGSK